MIAQYHEQKHNMTPDPRFVSKHAKIMDELVKTIPQMAIRMLQSDYTHKPEDKEITCTIHRTKAHYGYLDKTHQKLRRIWLDTTAYPHPPNLDKTPEREDTQHKKLYKVTLWKHSKTDTRVVGPANTSFPANTEWQLVGGEKALLQDMSIKFITNAKSLQQMKPPTAETEWPKRMPRAVKAFPKLWTQKVR